MKFFSSIATAAVAALVVGGATADVTNNSTVVDASPANGASGGVVGISQAGLTFVCDKVLNPLLTNELNNLKLPDIDTHKGSVSVHIGNMNTYDFECDDCIKVALVTGKGLQLDITDFTIKLHSRYVLKDIISTGGECESKLSHADVHGQVSIGVSSDGHPTLKISDVDANVQDLDLGCKGVSGSLLDALADVFKDKVESAINDAVQNAVPPAIDSLSKQLDKINLDIPITTNFAEVRFDLSTTPTVAADYISVPVLGTIVPVKNPGQVAPYPIPTLPEFDTGEESFIQILFSDYTINSAAYTYYTDGRLSRVIPPSAIPASSPIQLNTSSLALVAPGLAQKYPTAVPVQILAQADPLTKPQAGIHSDGVQITLPALLSFQPLPSPGKPDDGFTLSCPLLSNVSLELESSAITGEFKTANCTLTEFNSTVGAINVPALNDLAQIILTNEIIPAINNVTKAGFPIPTVDNFKLSNARLKLHEQYATLASDLAPTR